VEVDQVLVQSIVIECEIDTVPLTIDADISFDIVGVGVHDGDMERVNEPLDELTATENDVLLDCDSLAEVEWVADNVSERVNERDHSGVDVTDEFSVADGVAVSGKTGDIVGDSDKDCTLGVVPCDNEVDKVREALDVFTFEDVDVTEALVDALNDTRRDMDVVDDPRDNVDVLRVLDTVFDEVTECKSDSDTLLVVSAPDPLRVSEGPDTDTEAVCNGDGRDIVIEALAVALLVPLRENDEESVGEASSFVLLSVGEKSDNVDEWDPVRDSDVDAVLDAESDVVLDGGSSVALAVDEGAFDTDWVGCSVSVPEAIAAEKLAEFELSVDPDDVFDCDADADAE
jgi:hypothetical protein